MVRTQPSYSKMLELILPIWQNVFRRPSIKVNDNFFDLGGSPKLAEELFAEVAKVCGRAFPAVSIYHMPTPIAMASLLEDSESPMFEPPILMKVGDQEPPIFLAHGIGANILGFSELIKHIRTRRSIYAIQSRGIYGTEKALERMEDIAQCHLDAIKKTQTIGPYSLIGYSFGGLVMLEAAQRLLANGEEIALLVLIDAYPYRTRLKFAQKVRLYSQLLIRRLRGLGGFHSSKLSTRNRVDVRSTSNAVQAMNQLEISRQLERDACYSALRSYTPRFYNGKINFIRASIVTEFPDNAKAVWGHLASQLEVATIDGDHLAILDNEFEMLGTILSRYLAESDSQSTKSVEAT